MYIFVKDSMQTPIYLCPMNCWVSCMQRKHLISCILRVSGKKYPLLKIIFLFSQQTVVDDVYCGFLVETMPSSCVDSKQVIRYLGSGVLCLENPGCRVFHLFSVLAATRQL